MEFLQGTQIRAVAFAGSIHILIRVLNDVQGVFINCRHFQQKGDKMQLPKIGLTSFNLRTTLQSAIAPQALQISTRV